MELKLHTHPMNYCNELSWRRIKSVLRAAQGRDRVMRVKLHRTRRGRARARGGDRLAGDNTMHWRVDRVRARRRKINEQKGQFLVPA